MKKGLLLEQYLSRWAELNHLPLAHANEHDDTKLAVDYWLTVREGYRVGLQVGLVGQGLLRKEAKIANTWCVNTKACIVLFDDNTLPGQWVTLFQKMLNELIAAVKSGQSLEHRVFEISA